VVEQLSQTHKLYIVTNAVASVQRSRLANSAIAPYITAAFISEEAGAAKPSRAYFDYVMARIDGITAENCLVIGDSLSSDIQGANNAGLPACWYNLKGEPRPDDLTINYEIRDLRELYDIV
jgi:HAD superfamily hydrolase (TIGR01549 family)